MSPLPSGIIAASIELLTMIFAGLGFMKKKGMNRLIKVNRYIADLIELEENEGLTTEAWRKIREGAENGNGCVLDVHDCIYLNGPQRRSFKNLWDRYVKKPLAQAAALFKREAAEDETL